MNRLTEILQVFARNRLRTALTALAVSWGILMLVVLMGAGKGLENAVHWQFRDDATNSIWVRRGRTSLPYQGLRPGRALRFTNADHERIAGINGVEHITSRYYLWGGFTIRYGDRHGSFDVRACHPGHRYLEKTNILSGRFLNDADVSERRKVTVIGKDVAKHLFRGADPIGEWVFIKGIAYRVIGVFDDVGGLNELRKVYIPISTAQAAYGGGDQVHAIMFTVGDLTLEQTRVIEAEIREEFSRVHQFDPSDQRAIRIQNRLEQVERVTQTFGVIRLFLWLVGLGTIAAGIVGVGNIMLVSVAERTSEIGLRKAIGASSLRIIVEIVQEAMLLTLLSGYAGLVAGVALVELVAAYAPSNDVIRDPDADLSIAVVAVIVLVLAGLISGLIPAMRAAAVAPSHALRGGAE